MGDLNINLLNSSAPESRRLIQEAEFLDLKIIPLSSTHHTTTSHTWIDHFLTSKHSNIITSSQFPSSVSGHDLILVELSFPNVKSSPRAFEFRDFAKIDLALFLRDLNSRDWYNFTQSETIDYKVKFLNKAIFETLNIHAPIHRVLLKKPAAPWITDSIRSIMRQRDRCRDRSRRSDDPYYRTEFTRLRNLAKKVIDSGKSAYFVKNCLVPAPIKKKNLEKCPFSWDW